MLAIYKKELKSYFHSMIGYVFMAFFLVVIGIYMYVVNLVQQVANFEYALNYVQFIFIILVPILTMRVISEEKKQKTDQLLFTSSVSMAKIVIAKFLAVISLFIITMLIVCVYPIVLNFYGDVPFSTSYSSILGFTLIGYALIAVGLFISSLTESQIIAAVISFIVLLVSYLAEQLASVLPTEKRPTMLITLLVFAAFSFIIYLSMRNLIAALGIWAAGTAGLVLLYFFHASFYDNLLAKMVNAIAIMKPFDDFAYGTIYLSDIIYYLSIIALFIILTTLFIKDSLADKVRKGGTYRTTLMVIVSVICVAVNLFAGQLDVYADVSSQKMYSITQETIDYVKGVDSTIKMYYVVREGSEDPTVEKIVNKYDNLSSKVKVEKKDPVLYPNFTKKYTNDEVIPNSVIVVNEDNEKFKVVSYTDMFEYDQNTVYAIDVEGQLTAAIDFVTNENLPKLYYTTGHGEVEFGDTLTTVIKKKNVSYNSLATLTVDKIPEDCDILVINGATSDFSEKETAMVRLYLANGGDAIVTLQSTNNEMSNLKGLLEYYGIRQKEGMVLEQYGNYMSGYPTNIIPALGTHEIVSSVNASGRYVVMPNCIGLAASDTIRESVTATELMKTSDEAYSKVNMDSKTYEKEEEDIIGPFDLGILAEEKAEKTEDTTKLVVFSSVYLFNEEICSTGQFANADVLRDTLGYMVPTNKNIDISSISLTTSYLTMSGTTQLVLGVVFVIVLPLVILLTGLVIWLRRRKA
ncbi:Gldg family protein [[Clostridium] polysaccharolyticum]|uniref:ABC-2 type transport system permease protein n=1 Tax=[Clostridium] polysaccharolyticum TaxID=29364 RepID=A0A1H9ZE10_9FIRM|nr:Gldg family protein [[Clostridium] polysaccharolyticum]SES79723.1 ABC-2 type transport system permease protein [[Clostridium] polysaccharolyticum]